MIRKTKMEQFVNVKVRVEGMKKSQVNEVSELLKLAFKLGLRGEFGQLDPDYYDHMLSRNSTWNIVSPLVRNVERRGTFIISHFIHMYCLGFDIRVKKLIEEQGD
jgi:hypothetical protein